MNIDIKNGEILVTKKATNKDFEEIAKTIKAICDSHSDNCDNCPCNNENGNCIFSGTTDMWNL